MLGFDVELEAGDWPRGGRGREGSSGACSLVLEGEETTSPMSASKPNPRDASPLTKEREKDKGRRDATKKQHWALVRAHFFGNLFRSSPRDAIGGRTHSRARAKQSFARVRVSSCPPLFPRAPRFKEVPPPLSFPSKTSFFFDANLLERGGKNKSKKKDAHSFARRALVGNAAPRHANKKKERKRKGRTHRYSIGWKGRTEQSWGWSRTCFFSSSFCCVRVKMCEVPFFLFRRKKEK